MLLKSKIKWIRSIAFILLLLSLYATALHFNLFKYLTLDAILYNAEILFTIKEQYATTVLIIFILTYTISVIFCLPGSLVMKIISGFLFGSIFGSIVSIITYTISSVIAITIIRWLFGSMLQRNFSETIIMLKQKTNFDSLTNLIALRFMPLTPFWLYNIIMSLTGVSRKKFMLATTIATTPVSIALAIMGNSLHQINAINTKNLNDILYSPNFILPFFILSILFFLPNVFRYIKNRKIKKIANISSD